MVKDPLDNGQTIEIPFTETSFEKIEAIPVEPVVEKPPTFTPMADEKIQQALAGIRGRSFSGRNPHLGKMIKCQFCNRRHRESNVIISQSVTVADSVVVRKQTVTILPGCGQVFTYVKNGYEYFRDGKDGEKVPDYRTAIDPDFKPTPRQEVGSAVFKGRRINRHFNKKQLQLVERTRKVFSDMGFKETKGEQAEKNMDIARKEARHLLHREGRNHAKKKRDQQKRSRKINRGR